MSGLVLGLPKSLGQVIHPRLEWSHDADVQRGLRRKQEAGPAADDHRVAAGGHGQHQANEVLGFLLDFQTAFTDQLAVPCFDPRPPAVGEFRQDLARPASFTIR